MKVVEGSNALPGSYVPGTISIIAQRERYPTPFPESTFVSGHL